MLEDENEFLGFCDGLKSASVEDLTAMQRSLEEHIDCGVRELEAIREEIRSRRQEPRFVQECMGRVC